MMDTIGTRRVVQLAALAGVNVLMVAAIYLWLGPQSEYYAAKATDLKHKTDAARSHVVQMTTQLSTIQASKANYDKMEHAGLFTSQDRLDARNRILAIQKYSRVVTASYDIKPAVVDESPGEKLKTANEVILSTPIDITVDAVSDTDIYNFIYLLKNGMPGYVGTDSIELTRTHDVDDDALRSIASGKVSPLVQAKISFTWKTVNDNTGTLPGQPPKTGI